MAERVRPVPDQDLEHFPELVAELEGLGFVRLGRVALVGASAPELGALAYAEEHRARFVAAKQVPATVLVSAEGTTLVRVDWWWDAPEVRMRSLLGDGSLVETWRAWERMPVLPTVLRRSRGLDLVKEQRLFAAPRGGRSIALCAGSVAAQWAQHQERLAAGVAAFGDARAFRSLTEAVALQERVLDHDAATKRRVALRSRLLLLVWLAGVVALLVGAASDVRPLVWLSLASSALVLGFVLPGWGSRVRYAQWGRPAWRT